MTEDQLKACRTLNLAPTPGWMIVSAVRYAIRRETYIAKETQDWLMDNLRWLDHDTRGRIMIDIERDLLDERINTIDAPGWRRVAEKLSTHESLDEVSDG